MGTHMQARSACGVASRWAPLAAAALAVGLAGCGGGGGGGGGDAQKDPVNVQPVAEVYDLDAAMTHFYSVGTRIQGLRAADGASGLGYTMSFDLVPGQETTIDGARYPTVLRTTTTTADGQQPVVTRSIQAFSTAPFRLVRSVTDAGVYSVATRTGDLPSTAQPGSQGPLYTSVQYADSALATPLSTVEVTWTLERVDAQQSYLCIVNTLPNADPARVQTARECLLLDRTHPGEAMGAQVTYTMGSASLTFR